ncbi:aspartate/glutamate racemase family protein [Pectinatus frisingensis]|jgi:aspartate racemase|uniref:aspartate/glutamate racemase family protein n=1 Tax=Pectinatus frisingensis TaxID=865 RepID=UPI0018C722E3|nr:amino acid racemase [Pectinatus frisingensis]
MKTIGLIGGMGPMATVDLLKKIILSTDAQKDQDHIHVIVDNNTSIPDRSEAIWEKGPSPVPQLLESVNRLTDAGADFLIMSCNTAHYFLPKLQPHLRVPFLNMIEETAKYCVSKQINHVGLLASGGTYTSGIYNKIFANFNINVSVPDDAGTEICHKIIFEGVKAGNDNYNTQPFQSVLQKMRQEGAVSFILGCTEMPLAIKTYNIAGHFIDATQVLAESAVRFAGAPCKSYL